MNTPFFQIRWVDTSTLNVAIEIDNKNRPFMLLDALEELKSDALSIPLAFLKSTNLSQSCPQLL